MPETLGIDVRFVCTGVVVCIRGAQYGYRIRREITGGLCIVRGVSSITWRQFLGAGTVAVIGLRAGGRRTGCQVCIPGIR